MPRLYVIGDSFSIIKEEMTWPVWPVQVAQKIGYDLTSAALPGVDQDWQMREIRKLNLTPEDRLILVLTGPTRFWFFKDEPWLSNVAYGTYAKDIVKDDEKLYAIQQFLTHFWREDLFISFQKSRLGELAWLAHHNKWFPPLVITAFYNPINQEYPSLNITNGNLYEAIQLKEYTQKDPKKDGLMNGLWHSYDCRFNHLCRTNHEILAENIIDPLMNGTKLDLTSIKFAENIITDENACDMKFAEDQLNVYIFKQMLDTKTKEKLGVRDFRRIFY